MNTERIYQLIFSVGSAVVTALSPTLPYILLCTAAVLMDCWTAWQLDKRVRRAYPEQTSRNSGEFTSGGGGSYANRVSEGCGLGENDHIHVVSLAMGFNGTDTAAGAQTEFAALQTLIAAFRADYADTVFIVQLVTLTAAGDGVRPRTAKNASLLEFRRLCIEAYGNGQDSRVLLGDLGCCYDRWFAYRRALVPAAPQYSDQIEVIDQTASGGYAASDTTHPSDDGTKQMGESIVPVLLHAMQLADE